MLHPNQTLLQILSAFLIGGIVIATLSYLAEQSSRALRGIIIAFPSTMAVSFVFLALEAGPSSLKSSLTGVCYSLLSALLFAFTFTAVAQRFKDKTPETKLPIFLTLVLATVVWVVVVIGLAIAPQTLTVAIPCLLLGILVLQKLFINFANAFPVCSSPPDTGVREYLFRVVFAGSVVAGALIVAKTLGPFWGAVVGGTFPASFGSQLMIFQAKYPAKYLPSLIKFTPLGVLSSASYAIVTAYTYPMLGIMLGTFCGFFVSLVMSILVSMLSKRLELAT